VLFRSLNAIGLWASIVMKAAPAGAEGESTRHGASKINDGVRRMNALLHDLLDVASIDAGHLRIVTLERDAAAIVNDAIHLLAPLAAEKGLRIVIDTPDAGAGQRVSCDMDRIQQVLGNLIGNAIKFTPRDGAITVRIEPGEQDVRFSVADTGPGIPADACAHVFDRFWRGNQRDLTKGVGLGLFIARGIVEAHGGKLWVARPLGHGATFHFTLPLASPRVQAGTTSAPLQSGPAGPRTKDEP
jgi:signal transduction histidine kinase